MPAFDDDLKQDAPVAYAAAITRKALQFADVPLKWILLHLREDGHDARLVARRNSLKRLSCGTGEHDGPFYLSTPEAS
jgi:hypothetical protein